MAEVPSCLKRAIDDAPVVHLEYPALILNGHIHELTGCSYGRSVHPRVKTAKALQGNLCDTSVVLGPAHIRCNVLHPSAESSKILYDVLECAFVPGDKEHAGACFCRHPRCCEADAA
jgi:hypothetical protein